MAYKKTPKKTLILLLNQIIAMASKAVNAVPYYTYVLRLTDGSYYCGATNDLIRRLGEHIHGKTGKSYSIVPAEVVSIHFHGTHREAYDHERTLFEKFAPEKMSRIYAQKKTRSAIALMPPKKYKRGPYKRRKKDGI